MSGSERAPSRPNADLRLLPLVGSLWAGQAVVLLLGPGSPLLVAGAGGAALALALGLASVRAQRGPGWGAAGFVRVLVVSGAALGAMVGGLHLARLHPGLVDRLTEEAAVVRAVVRITGDPAAHRVADDGGRTTAPTWSVPGRMIHVSARGAEHALSVPVLLQGAATERLRYGSVVQLTGRAGPSWSPQDHALALSVLGDVHERAPPGAVARATSSIRAVFRAACSGLPADAGALLLGLAVGDESAVTPELDTAMIRSGLAHLTAVSGTNTSLVVGAALGLAVALGLGWRARVAAGLMVLAGYVALVRPQPSVLRAAMMGLVGLLALTTGGRRRGPPALLAACLVLLLAVPPFALSIGFGLSVAATAGLLVVGPPIADRLGRWPLTRHVPEPVRAALAVAAAAHLATVPLVVLMGNGVSRVTVPATVLAAPLVPVATILGLAAALLAPVAAGPAALLAGVAAPATGAIAWVARTASGVPHGVLPVGPGPVASIGAAAVLGLGAVAARRRWRPWADRRVVAALAVAALMLLVVRHQRDARWPPPDWLVLACDVGQGDALLMRAPGAGSALLVDTGPDPGRVAACLRGARVRELVVLLTHFHADHIDGLGRVLDDWPVEQVLVSAVLDPTEGAARVAEWTAAAGVPLATLRAGDALTAAGIDLAVLWPARAMADSPANNGSVVAVAELPAGPAPLRVLLTGDIEPEAQAAVMAAPSPLADVVKVPHHGSTYQAAGFAAWTGARIALVSVGRGNDFGHPSAATLAGYRRSGALVGRTDADGALGVVLLSGGPALVRQR